MSTYYAKVVLEGTSTPQLFEVQASSLREAKVLIEGRAGIKVRHWRNSPTAATRPPSWYTHSQRRLRF